MIVVSDTSPIRALDFLDLVPILGTLFDRVFVPPTVNTELNSPPQQFDAIDPRTTKHLLGLFEPSYMQYEHDRKLDTAGEPSLRGYYGKGTTKGY